MADDTIDAVLAKIEKLYGKGTVVRLGEKSAASEKVISTGALSLDIALGGGFPVGRIIEIYGPESSGKTTLALHAVAEAQKAGGTCVYVDVEHALDPIYAAAIGVNVDDLLFVQPDSAEQALEIVDSFANSGIVALIVVDSIAALVPRAMIEGEMGDAHVGLQARLMSQACKKLTGPAARNETAIIFINQLRHKIGVMFGSPETTPGGLAMKFAASVRLDIRKIEVLKDGGEIIGNRTKVKVIKNKIAPPLKIAEFDIMFGEGVSYEGNLVDVGLERGVLKKSGAWISYNSENIGQGRENAKNFLKDYPEVAEAIREQILHTL